MLDRHIVPVAKNGRMNLPSALRSKLDLDGGGKIVFIEKENGEVEVTTLRRSLKRAQDLVRQSIPADVDLVSDLIEERRAEALREAEGGK
ncbi:AbrB/MazE/SpoVT family DNA-binding domain-containing protein [Fulvimarina sp. MAC8]|uniref:AbrB/MazE/SpoVT family DNA-binding domain-containing protein n=1 Tax=Fulvimarina sp. MAC8 TaxID=3162874 RepID=UPI0032EF2C5E